MAQEDVFRDSQVTSQVKLLVDCRNAQRLCILRTADFDRLALKANLAFVLSIATGQNLDLCRFAGSVLTQESMDLTFSDSEIDALQRLDTGETLADALHLEQNLAGG